MSYRGLPVLEVLRGRAMPAAPTPEVKSCRKATKEALKRLPVPSLDALAVLTPEAVQRRWIRVKCDRCRACPDMVS